MQVSFFSHEYAELRREQNKRHVRHSSRFACERTGGGVSENCNGDQLGSFTVSDTVPNFRENWISARRKVEATGCAQEKGSSSRMETVLVHSVASC